MHKLFLTLRYLRKRRIAFFGIAAVALCVALLIVITSIFSGFIQALHNFWQQSYGQIMLNTPKPMHPYEALVEQIEKIDGIANARATIHSGGLLYLASGDVRAVAIAGLDLARFFCDEDFRKGLLMQHAGGEEPVVSLSKDNHDKFNTWYKKKFRRSASDADLPIPAILGIGLLAKPDELTDEYDRRAIVEQLQQFKTPMFIISGKRGDMSVKKIRKLCWPVNAIETGTYFADTTTIYLPFDYARDMIGTDGPDGKKECNGTIRIYLEPGIINPHDFDRIKQRLRHTWTQFALGRLNWSMEQAAGARISDFADDPQFALVTHEIRKQLAILQLIVGMICLVVALLIFVILYMIVMQKKKDIGIIRAIGASRRSVAFLFLQYGAAIGLAGSVLGLALGAWATSNIAFLENILTGIIGFKIWKSSVYFFSDIPNQVAWSAVYWILLTGVLTATIGATLPAIRAARLQPVEDLRYE